MCGPIPRAGLSCPNSTVAVNSELPKLGIIAGGGLLPHRVVAACRDAGRPFCIVAIRGEADAPIAAEACATVGLGQAGHIFSALRTEGCGEVTMVGKVARPDFRTLKTDWRGLALLPRIVAAARRGDDALLSTLGRIFEAEGFRLVGVEGLAPDLIVSSGPLSATVPDAEALKDIARAAAVVRSLGPFDVGQAAVVCAGLVLAIEAAEGTDAMLARCAELPEALRGTAGSRRGVLVKLPKPDQDRRLDLPTIGPKTVDGAIKAGLSGIAVEAGGAVIVDRADVLAAADQHGLFVYGFNAGQYDGDPVK